MAESFSALISAKKSAESQEIGTWIYEKQMQNDSGFIIFYLHSFLSLIIFEFVMNS